VNLRAKNLYSRILKTNLQNFPYPCKQIGGAAFANHAKGCLNPNQAKKSDFDRLTQQQGIKLKTHAGGKEKECAIKRGKNEDKEKDKTSGSKRSREDTEVASAVAGSMLGEKKEEMAKNIRKVACEACKKRKKGLQFCLNKGVH